MKAKRKIFVIAIATALAAFATPSFAQDGQGATNADSEQGTRTIGLQKDDRVLSQLLKNPEDAPEGLRAQLVALRESQQLIRSTWIETFRPGDGASAEAIKAAREAFQGQFADEIRASKELRMSLMRELRSGLRGAVDDAAWNEQARTLYAEYKLTQSELSNAWRAVRSELGDDATREQIAAAKARFNEANADLIALQKELAKQVRDFIRDNRQERTVARDELPQELQVLRSDMAALRDQVRTRQNQAREEMRSLGREEREQYRRALLEDLKELHDEIKERRRQVIEEIRDGRNGDRRPEG